MGQVAVYPRINALYQDYMLFLIIALTELKWVEYVDVEKSIRELKLLCRELAIKRISLPVMYQMRKISWYSMVEILDKEFWDETVEVVAYHHYYLSIT